MAQPLEKAIFWLLKCLCIELPYDPAIPLLDIYTRMSMYKNVYNFIIPNSQKIKIPKCPSTNE